MTRKQPETAAIHTLLSEVVAEVNTWVPSDTELAAVSVAAHDLSKSRRPGDQRTAELMRDGAERLDSVDGELRAYYELERRRIGTLFRVLAKTGRLPKGAADELLYHCRSGVRSETQTGWRDGKPFVDFVPTFDNALAKAAYVLVTLANEDDVGYRIVGCKHCGTLTLFQLGKKGRPAEFCSLKHGVAFAQAEKRRRDAKIIESRLKAKAAKHK